MKTFACLIVDDEELARRLIASYCERLPQLKVVGQAANPLEAMQILREQRVDILFLDIQMPEMKGTDMLRVLRKAPAVILTTAYAEYALESYELDVVDYLLKPFPFERFLRAIGKVEDLVKKNALEETALEKPDVTPLLPTYQIVKSDYKVYRIPHETILYVESMREYVAYHTAEGKTLSLGSLRQLEKELPDNFLRVHKSFIIAKDKVSHLEGNMLHIGSAMVPIGASYRTETIKTLFGDKK
jgi:DNA-binding LytR/AlgR family response regulator